MKHKQLKIDVCWVRLDIELSCLSPSCLSKGSFFVLSQKAHDLIYVLSNRTSWIRAHSNMLSVSLHTTKPANPSSTPTREQGPIQWSLSFRFVFVLTFQITIVLFHILRMIDDDDLRVIQVFEIHYVLLTFIRCFLIMIMAAIIIHIYN